MIFKLATLNAQSTVHMFDVDWKVARNKTFKCLSTKILFLSPFWKNVTNMSKQSHSFEWVILIIFAGVLGTLTVNLDHDLHIHRPSPSPPHNPASVLD